MGRGDIKTRKGKISNGTFGVSRPHKSKVVTPKKKIKSKAKPKAKVSAKEKNKEEK